MTYFKLVRFNHTWVKPEGYNTGINVYNCLARDKVPLIVKDKNLITWYTCGPTVYDSPHIGHGSCYVKLDIIQRILKDYFGLNLLTAMNVTDVDDKIIKKSQSAKIPESVLTRKYEKQFLDDLNSLKVRKPDLLLRVTDCMPQITNFVKRLLDNGSAYVDTDGSITFNIKSAKYFYGKLQNIRQKDGNADDHSIKDFTIWKRAKENEPFWETDFGPGRPGWHTECSALASATFGSSIDIHAGGIDLRFPHHENEEAQCCATFSKPQWVNYWLHTGHLLHNSTKMSKSIKNTTSVTEILAKCDSDTFRVMCLMAHYRNNMEVSQAYIDAAEILLKSYRNFVSTCLACLGGKFKATIDGDAIRKSLEDAVVQVRNALCNDFDTNSCINITNSVMTDINKMFNSLGTGPALSDLAALVSALNFVTNMFGIFGVQLEQRGVKTDSDISTDVLDILTEYRQSVRNLGLERKDGLLLGMCDDVRNNLSKIGVNVKDHGKLSSWSK